MGRKKQGKFVRPDNKGKDKRHKMKGKSLEAFTEEMHTAFEGNNASTIHNPKNICIYIIVQLPYILHVGYKTMIYSCTIVLLSKMLN